MLKKIPKILSPELLKILAEMGHSDIIVIADGNFPGASNAQRLIRADGIDIPSLLDGILEVFPLDDFVPHPVSLMDAGDFMPPIWETYAGIIKKHDADAFKNGFHKIERFAFYDTAKTAYAIVQSGEGALYANIILQKGVIRS